MKFRPCIDLHDGQVKQIVGSTLTDKKEEEQDQEQQQNQEQDTVIINFATTKPSSYYAKMYATDNLVGGHIIMLGPNNVNAAIDAIQSSKPNTIQVGGGITLDNASLYLNAGASHIIVTSYIFNNGIIHYNRLQELCTKYTKHKIVLDLSCRKKKQKTTNTDNVEEQEDIDNNYYVVTDKWQKYTTVSITKETLQNLAQYCDEFLIHAVDVEGKQCGIEEELISLLYNCYVTISNESLLKEESSSSSSSSSNNKNDTEQSIDTTVSNIVQTLPKITYAGGVRSIDDLNLIELLGHGIIDCTIGSALDIFGGSLQYTDVIQWHKQRNP